MKVLVFGGHGKMGKAVAYDLVRDDAVEEVGLAARSQDALENAGRWLESHKVTTHVLDVSDKAGVQSLMGDYQVGVSTLPDRHTSYLVAQAAVESGFNMVDMLEEYHRAPDEYETENLLLPAGMALAEYGEWLHQTAVENGSIFLDGIGFAPGLSNITTGEAIRKLDTAESAVARVGGIPSKEAAATRPLRYMITWSFDHVLREYMIRVNVRKDGQVIEVDATTDREAFLFDKLGQNEMLECAITPGMPSFIFTRPELREFAEKTVRWPGHWQGVETLKECGLLDIEPVQYKGRPIVPRDLLNSLIEPKLQAGPGDTDVCVMYNTIDGLKDGRKTRISYHMWDQADTAAGISSMGRVTGFPAAIGAVMIGNGMIKEKGLVPPEDCFYGETYTHFMGQLEKRNIHILETIEEID